MIYFFSSSNGEKVKLNYLYLFHSQIILTSRSIDQSDIEVTKILIMSSIWVSFHIIRNGSLQQNSFYHIQLG